MTKPKKSIHLKPTPCPSALAKGTGWTSQKPKATAYPVISPPAQKNLKNRKDNGDEKAKGSGSWCLYVRDTMS